MIRVLIAEDHAIVREGIKRLLAGCEDIEVAAETGDGHAVLRLVTDQPPDVVLLDVSMPGPGFLHVIDHLKRTHPQVKVLVLSIHAEEVYAVRAIRAGARGYLGKDRTPEELLRAIRRVYGGGRYVTDTLGERLAAGADDGVRPRYETLSDREYEILRLLAGGLRPTDIARKLSLSPKTVSTYRTRILEKMGFRNNADLFRYALEHDLVD